MLSKKQKKDEATDEDSDELSSSDSSSEYASDYESGSVDEPKKDSELVPDKSPATSSDKSSSSEQEGSDSESDRDTMRAATGRGRGRGRGRAGRGRWSRGARASFNRGRGAGRTASRAAVVMPVGDVPLQATKSTKSMKPQLKAATLLAKVQKTVPTTATESSDDLTTSSDDDELEELAQEVKRFEKMMNKKVAVPGFVPVFTEPERAKGASEQLTLDTVMQKRILKRERQLYNPEEEDLMDSIAGYEMTEMEKLVAAAKQVGGGPTKDTTSDNVSADAVATPTNPVVAHAAPQHVVSETEEDIEVEVGGEPYLVDLDSGLVFHLVSSGEPPEVGTWNPASRKIEFR